MLGVVWGTGSPPSSERTGKKGTGGKAAPVSVKGGIGDRYKSKYIFRRRGKRRAQVAAERKRKVLHGEFIRRGKTKKMREDGRGKGYFIPPFVGGPTGTVLCTGIREESIMQGMETVMGEKNGLPQQYCCVGGKGKSREKTVCQFWRGTGSVRPGKQNNNTK